MLVYRVENKNGVGPYTGIRGIRHVLGRKHGRGGVHLRPLPQDDGITMEHHTALVCGFCTMTQLRYWFTPRDLRILADLGYTIRTYHTEDVLVGGKQIMFLKP